MGSSIVIIWQLRVRLMASTTQASVVDLPLPAGPVTSASPRVSSVRRMTFSVMPRAFQSGMPNLTIRMTAASEPRCLNTLTRKRASPGKDSAKSSSHASAFSGIGLSARA